jgi:hypothetical protein
VQFERSIDLDLTPNARADKVDQQSVEVARLHGSN